MTASGVFPFLGDIPLIPWCDVDGFPFQSVFIRVKCGDYCCPVRHSAAGCGGRADRQTVRALQGRCTGTGRRWGHFVNALTNADDSF